MLPSGRSATETGAEGDHRLYPNERFLCHELNMSGPDQPRGWNTPLHGKSRLMMPRVGSTESLTGLKLLGAQASDAEGDDCGTTDLLIQGLLDRLPKPNSIWSLDDRARWLRTAASIFGLVYRASDGEHTEIRVVFAKEEAANQQPVTGLVSAESNEKSSPVGESRVLSGCGSPPEGGEIMT